MKKKKPVKVDNQKVWLCKKIDPCEKIPKGFIIINSWDTKADAFFTDSDWDMITTKAGSFVPAQQRFIAMPDHSTLNYPILSSVDLILFSEEIPSLDFVKQLLNIQVPA
jgi:hypothetical protein